MSKLKEVEMLVSQSVVKSKVTLIRLLKVVNVSSRVKKVPGGVLLTTESRENTSESGSTDGGFPFPPVGISLSPQAIKPTAANIASITAIIITNLLRKVNGFKIDLFIKSMFCFHKNTKFTGIFKMHKYGNNSNPITALFNYSYGSY